MYNAFFGFKDSPFNLSPDPSFLYRSPQHEEALANLSYGVQSRKGFIVLTGEVGTGKTTMLQCLRDFLENQRTEFAFLFNSRVSVEQFFERPESYRAVFARCVDVGGAAAWQVRERLRASGD